MEPEHVERAGAVVRIGRATGRRLAVQHARIRRVAAVRADESVIGQGLAAMQRDHRLALRGDGGGEVVNDGWQAGSRDSGAERRRAAAAFDRAVRRDEQAAAHVHHVDGCAVGLRGALRPVSDAAEVAGIPERGDRHPVPARLFDPDVDRLLADRLSESAAAVDDGQRLGLAHHLHPPAGEDPSVPHPLHVTVGAEHAVGVVSAKIGAGEPPRDAMGLFRIAAGAFEDRAHEPLHRRRIHAHLPLGAAHVRAFVRDHPRVSASVLAHAAV